jgi:hypothetical protein
MDPYIIRGREVFIDHDLARIFYKSTKHINQIAKRNPARFPTSFCFRLTKAEMKLLLEQESRRNLKEKTEDDERRKEIEAINDAVEMMGKILNSDSDPDSGEGGSKKSISQNVTLNYGSRFKAMEMNRSQIETSIFQDKVSQDDEFMRKSGLKIPFRPKGGYLKPPLVFTEAGSIMLLLLMNTPYVLDMSVVLLEDIVENAEKYRKQILRSAGEVKK